MNLSSEAYIEGASKWLGNRFALSVVLLSSGDRIRSIHAGSYASRLSEQMISSAFSHYQPVISYKFAFYMFIHY